MTIKKLVYYKYVVFGALFLTIFVLLHNSQFSSKKIPKLVHFGIPTYNSNIEGKWQALYQQRFQRKLARGVASASTTTTQTPYPTKTTKTMTTTSISPAPEKTFITTTTSPTTITATTTTTMPTIAAAAMTKTIATTQTTMTNTSCTTTTATINAVPVMSTVSPIVMSNCNGRLGNQMCTLATMYAIEQKFGPKPYMNQFQLDIMAPHFKTDIYNSTVHNLDQELPNWKNISWTGTYPPDVESSETKWPPNNVGFINIPIYPCDIKLFKPYLPDLRKIFQINSDYIEEAKVRLDIIGRNFSQTVGLGEEDSITYVSIHARRTDYAAHLASLYELEYVEDEYFFKAIQFYKNKYTNILFYVMSDDVEWCKTTLVNFEENVYYIGARESTTFSEEDQKGIDLSLLSMANHSVVTYGSFGIWGALLAGGQMTFPKSHLHDGTVALVAAANFSNIEFL